MNPRFSVVMPVSGVEARWLERAIRSVLRQTMTDWELCAVDDGSPSDAPRSVLEEAAARDSRLKVRFLPENFGIGLAPNPGCPAEIQCLAWVRGGVSIPPAGTRAGSTGNVRY